MARKKKAANMNGGAPPSSAAPTNAGQDELKINQQFAQSYDETQRKKLLRDAPAALFNEDDASSTSSSSEEEDELGELLTKRLDRGISATLNAIQAKDPRIYDRDVRFYEEPEQPHDSGDGGSDSDADRPIDSEDEPVAGWDAIANAANRDAPRMTLKDYVRENLLTRGTLAESDEDDENADEADRRPDYEHERDEVNQASKKVTLKHSDNSSSDDDQNDANEDQNDEDFFSKKNKTAAEIEQEEKDFEKFLEQTAKKRNKAASDDLLLHSYLQNETPDEKDRFLRDFILNNGWLDKNTADAPAAGDYAIEVDLAKMQAEGGEEDEDESFDDKVDKFEAGLNFRFEDPNADKIVFHARTIPDSMRRPDDRRKRARQARKERKEKEKAVKTEDIKRLKNEKKKEIQARLLAIKEAAGDDVDVTGIDLDGDFDASAFDKQMEQRFGDEYYAKKDKQLTSVGKEGVGVVSERRVQGSTMEEASEDIREDVNRMMDEYYNLDYEDIVGGTPMRFNYKQVEPESFNLSTEQILEKDDKELNQLVSLKYYAPYRPKRDVQKQAWRVKNALKEGKTKRQADAHEVESTEKSKKRKRKKTRVQDSAEGEAAS